MKKSIKNIKNKIRNRFLIFLFLIFFLNLLIPIISPFLGFGIKENYFLYIHFGIERFSHLIFTLKLFIGLFLFILVTRLLLSNLSNILDFLKNRTFKPLFSNLIKLFNKNSPQIYILNFINFFFTIIIILYTSFIVECDGITHFQFSKCFSFSNQECVISHRPFLYPLYISISGCFLFDSLIPIITFNIILSTLMINYIFITFKNIGKNISLIITILFILCGFHVLYIFSLAEMHLVLFFLISAICSIINFHSTSKKSFFYIALISLFLCFYTRLDTIIILIFGLISLFLIIIKDDKTPPKKKLYLIKPGLIITFIFFTGWVVYKSSMIYFHGGPSDRYNKNSLINSFFSISLNHYEGFQLFWRMNHYELDILKITGEDIRNINAVNLGEISTNFKEILYESIQNENSKKYLLSLKPMIKQETWDLHYGMIDSNPKQIINQLFDPNFYIDPLVYPIHIPEILKVSIGVIKTNEILKEVYYGFKEKYPILQKSIFYDFLQGYGFKDPIYHNPNFYIFDNKSFNVGNCAKTGFSPKIFNFYKNLYEKRINSTKTFYNYYQFTFKYSRHFLGILSILFLLIGFYYKDFIIIYFINFSYLASNYLIANFIETNGKPASYLIPLIFFNIFFIFKSRKN